MTSKRNKNIKERKNNNNKMNVIYVNKKRKEEAGITLVAMAVTIVVLMMIAIPCIVNIKTVSETDKFTKLKNDITVLKESISQVYASDDTSKIGPKYTGDKSFLNIYQGEKNVTKTSKDIVKNPNDNDNYYVINVSKLKRNLKSKYGIGLVDLNYGDNNYGIDTTLKELNTTDVYIINEKSRTIYYTAGVNYTSGASGKQYVYYRLPEDFTKINISSFSYVGYYADVDDDGTVDGVIFADMSIGNTKSGKWNNNRNSTYTIPTKTNLNSYYISQASYTGKFGTNAVISPVNKGNSTHNKDRFYVMALTDIDGKRNGTYYDWYNAAFGHMNDYAETTSGDFGKGKSNTTTMISKWNAKAYGNQDKCSDHKDMWGQIQEEVNNGWFVPSRAEWSAFGGELGITSSNYGNFGLSGYYWSSSLYGTGYVHIASFGAGLISGVNVNGDNYVRLSATF